MNTLIVFTSILVSCYAGGYDKYGSKSVQHFGGEGFGGLFFGGGGGGGVGGQLVGGGGVGGQLVGGGVLGGGALGGFVRSVVKYGTCPDPNEVDSQQIGPYCFNDDGCHGSQKCCRNNIYGGYRCQIPLEYQRYGYCNSNFVDLPFHPTRRACNDDTICPFYGKCCRRRSSGQIDTCTYPSVPYQLRHGGLGGSVGPVGGGSFGPVGGGSFGPVGGGSFGPVGGPGVVSPLLPLLPQGSFKKKY